MIARARGPRRDEQLNAESEDPNLQDRRMHEMLGGYDPDTDSFVSAGANHVVEHVDADDFGGATISLSSGYRIVIFPNGSAGEDWRMLLTATDLTHLVVGGGAIISAPGQRESEAGSTTAS
jgi:hypothetical protein